MNRGVYTLALRALSPLIWLWMGHRARRAGGQWEIFSPQRFGRLPAASSSDSQAAPVWVHAVLWGVLTPLLAFVLLRVLKATLIALQYKHQAGEVRE